MNIFHIEYFPPYGLLIIHLGDIEPPYEVEHAFM